MADRTVPSDVTAWPRDDLELLIEEGRRHLDRLLDDLHRTRARAQHAFALALALLVVIAAQLPASRDQGLWAVSLLTASGWLVALGLVGGLAVMVVQIQVDVIHAGVLSTKQPPVRPALANDYTGAVVATQQATQTLLTVYREAALYLSLGAALDGLYWLLYQV